MIQPVKGLENGITHIQPSTWRFLVHRILNRLLKKREQLGNNRRSVDSGDLIQLAGRLENEYQVTNEINRTIWMIRKCD